MCVCVCVCVFRAHNRLQRPHIGQENVHGDEIIFDKAFHINCYGIMGKEGKSRLSKL